MSHEVFCDAKMIQIVSGTKYQKTNGTLNKHGTLNRLHFCSLFGITKKVQPISSSRQKDLESMTGQAVNGNDFPKRYFLPPPNIGNMELGLHISNWWQKFIPNQNSSYLKSSKNSAVVVPNSNPGDAFVTPRQGHGGHRWCGGRGTRNGGGV